MTDIAQDTHQAIIVMGADWADDSGKWGELTRNTQATASKSAASGSPAASQAGRQGSTSQRQVVQDYSRQRSASLSKRPASAARQQEPSPKQSSISLADITADLDEEPESIDAVPDQAGGGSHMGGVGVKEGLIGGRPEARRSYLSLLESLAQESDFGSMGNSDSEPSPHAAQAPKPAESWRETQPEASKGIPSPARVQLSNVAVTRPVTAEGSNMLSEVSVNFDDDAVEALLPDEASDTHMQSANLSAQAVPAGTSRFPLLPQTAAAESSCQQAEQPSALALALAALAATAAQQPSQQQLRQQPEPEEAAAEANPLADADDQVSLSSASSGDVLADAAAAAAAAGLSRRRESPPPQQPVPHVAEASVAASASSQADVRTATSAAASQAAESRPSEAQIQTRQAQQAQQELKRQRASASRDWPGPASSGPSWSGSDARGVGRFQDNQAVNYVGKSARRPKVSLLVQHYPCR